MKKKLRKGLSPGGRKVCKTRMILHLVIFLFFVSIIHAAASVYSIKDRLSMNVEYDAPQPQNAVKGKVTDQSGTPIPGVSVVVKGTTTGTTTDTEGNFSRFIVTFGEGLSGLRQNHLPS